jgi:proteic killer suppression protein
MFNKAMQADDRFAAADAGHTSEQIAFLALAKRHVTRYILGCDQDLRGQANARTVRDRQGTSVPAGHAEAALRKLEQINAAYVISDLRAPPSNRLHALGRDHQGHHSNCVNDQRRICFLFEDGDAYDVEICDYH